MKTSAIYLSASVLCLLGSTAVRADDLPSCAKMPANADTYACSCPADARKGSVWGSGPYTADSDLCTAARHAGVITKTGGDINVTRMPGQSSYDGSRRNDVTSNNWGSFPSSIAVAPVAAELPACTTLPKNADTHSCTCPADAPLRSAWGSGPYTGDSDLCTAARHAGVLDASGGAITATRLPGQSAYQGSRQNDVRTDDWNSYPYSVEVARAKATISASGAAPACTALPKGADSLSCHCDSKSFGGSVWGSGPYTTDSAICAAALHAGAVEKTGGTVHVLRLGGLDAYSGSKANGITTRDWPAFDSSYVFDRN